MKHILNAVCVIANAGVAVVYLCSYLTEGHQTKQTKHLVFAIIWATCAVIWLATTILTARADK